MRAKENALRSKAQLEDTLRELELFNRLITGIQMFHHADGKNVPHSQAF